MSKLLGSGAAWMLILLIATTMFAIADFSLLSSDEKGSNSLNGRKFEGAWNGLNVDVTSKSGTIKATINVKKGDKDYSGSITIGSCTVKGEFLTLKAFHVKEISSSFASPIKIVATATEVTLQGTEAPIQACNSAPFELEEDKSVKTTVKLYVDTGNIVSLELDPSVEVVERNNANNLRPLLWSLIALFLVL
ncbi:hypothetical protein M3Y94_00091500 [Aphelenchoides besseyi]|nr:hypothetical protein M3Y94_00091500 [Aphelenchoides besseyi]